MTNQSQPFPLSPATRDQLQLLATRLETRAGQEFPGPLPKQPAAELALYARRYQTIATTKKAGTLLPGILREEFGWLEIVVRAYRGHGIETRAQAEARRVHVGALVRGLATSLRRSGLPSLSQVDEAELDIPERPLPQISDELVAKIGVRR